MGNQRPYNDMEDHEGDSGLTRFLRKLVKVLFIMTMVAVISNPDRETDNPNIQKIKDFRAGVTAFFFHN